MSRCACGQSRPSRKCCGPILSGARPAPDAESLVRARYSAFVAGDMDFLLRTTHDKTMCRFNLHENSQWAATADWLGMEILSSEAGETSEDGETVELIEFRARFIQGGIERQHHEVSELRRGAPTNAEWRFYDGTPAKKTP